MDELDDLLDDIEIDTTLNDDDVGGDIKPTLASLPEEMKKRWVLQMVADLKADATVKLLRSAEYRSWDESKNIRESPSPHKLLQDGVRCACVKCNFDESKLLKVLSMSNMFNSESGKILQSAYNKQVLTDLKKIVLSNPDYDPAKFPALAKYYA